MNIYDIVIAGGGMAGLTAAIYGSRAGLSVLVLERDVCGGLANWTESVENFPSHISIGGMDLMKRIAEQAETLGAVIEEITLIEQFDLRQEIKRVKTDEGISHYGRSVILALGREPRRLDPGLEWEEHTHYCSVCDGSLYRGKDVVVVGGGNSGFDETLYLLRLGVASITIVEEMENCAAVRTTIEKAIASGRVAIRAGSVIESVHPNGEGADVVLVCKASGKRERVFAHGIFVFIGQVPNTAALDGIVPLDRDGYIRTDSAMHTGLSGVFAAGDVVVKRHRQLVTAAADGAIAAMEAERFLSLQSGQTG